MRILDIQTKKVTLKGRKVFKSAFDLNDSLETVYVKILTDIGLYGLGEACPLTTVTGETVDGVIAAIEFMKERLVGENPEEIEIIHAIMDNIIVGNTSAKAAVDMACYDIMGKSAGMPVHKLIGATKASLVTDATIGIDYPDIMINEAVRLVNAGFRVLKIKCGVTPDTDYTIVKRIREAVGDKVHIRIDANQAYTIDTAKSSLEEMLKIGIKEVEQPLPAWDIDGMAEVKKNTDVTLMIDEGVHTPEQALVACWHDACDVINIKLMKCGGIYPALRICEIAESYGKTCMIGCMTESKLGISAAAAVAVTKDNIKYIDLDSYLSFSDDSDGVQGGFETIKDMIVLSDKAGLGFEEYEF